MRCGEPKRGSDPMARVRVALWERRTCGPVALAPHSLDRELSIEVAVHRSSSDLIERALCPAEIRRDARKPWNTLVESLGLMVRVGGALQVLCLLRQVRQLPRGLPQAVTAGPIAVRQLGGFAIANRVAKLLACFSASAARSTSSRP